jgi:hypothetical protein
VGARGEVGRLAGGVAADIEILRPGRMKTQEGEGGEKCRGETLGNGAGGLSW